MPSSFFTPTQLENLYINQHLSTYGIAENLGCDPKTVYYWLKKYNISTRPRKIVQIEKTDLEKLYKAGLSLKEIGNRLGCTPAAILRKFRKFSISTRLPWEANIIHPKNNFSNNPDEKAYLIGFRIGDLGVKKASIHSSIQITSSTTHLVQIKLLKNLFSKYGPMWIGQPKKFPVVYHFSTLLNNSFSFLIPKHSRIPNYILKSKKSFLHFLAGYTDAEGSIGIYNNRAKFRIGSYDKDILEQIHKVLLSLHVKNTFILETKAGKRGKWITNGDFYRVTLNDRVAINTCLTLILPYLKHEKRRQNAIFALKNVRARLQ